MGYNIIGGIILGFITGVIIGAIIIDMFRPSKSIYGNIIMIITITLFSAICTLGLTTESESFNNGYCIECGTKYEAITHRNGHTYYECPNCYFGIWH